MGKRVTFDPSGAKLAKKTKYEYSLCGGPRSPAALFSWADFRYVLQRVVEGLTFHNPSIQLFVLG